MGFFRRLIHNQTRSKATKQPPKPVVDNAGVYETRRSKLDRLGDSIIDKIEEITKTFRKKLRLNGRSKKRHFDGSTLDLSGIEIWQDQPGSTSLSVSRSHKRVPAGARKIVSAQALSRRRRLREILLAIHRPLYLPILIPRAVILGILGLSLLKPGAYAFTTVQPEAIELARKLAGRGIQVTEVNVVDSLDKLRSLLSMSRQIPTSRPSSLSPRRWSLLTDVRSFTANLPTIERPAAASAYIELARMQYLPMGTYTDKKTRKCHRRQPRQKVRE